MEQRLLQQVKKSLTKPTGEVKKEETSSVGTSSSGTPEPSSGQEGFILPPLNTAKGSKESLNPMTTIRSGSTNASPMKTMFPSILTGGEAERINYSPRNKPKVNMLEGEWKWALKCLHKQFVGVSKVMEETRG